MMRLVALLLLPLTLASAEGWLEVRSGPFEVLTDAGNRAAGRAMAYCEQLRGALGMSFGKTELTTVWPIRIVVFRDAQTRSRYPSLFIDGRDAHLGALVSGAPVPREFAAGIVRILLRDNTSVMPASIENGLVALFSTLDVKGVRVTLGAPPPLSERNLDWARLQMLATNPEYGGRLRVMLGNLGRGAPLDASCKNAFGRPIADIDKEAAAYLAAGNFQTAAVSARPIDPDHDYYPKEVPPARIEAVLAELRSNPLPEAEPGARTLVAMAEKEGDAAKARALLDRAMKLNPHWAEPHARLAMLETDADERAAHLRAAAKLDPRGRYEDKARATEAAEEARIEEQRKRELERIWEAELARVRAAEEKANRAAKPLPPGEKVEPWWDGPRPDRKVEGLLERVDCVRGTARLSVRDASRGLTQLLIREPGKVALSGAKDATLACGPQRKPRRVIIEYFAKPDKQSGTVGEVATVEFR
ncbi:MAG: hypothetical protein ABFD86_22630 [Bryobacteraceae bacterium]